MVLRKGKDDTNVDRAAPYFCDYVKSWLKENLPDIDLSKGGYTIETTLDTGMQKSIDGYKYLFHRQLELRTLKRV